MKAPAPETTAADSESLPTQPPRRVRCFCLRWLKRGTILLLFLATLGALLWAVENWRGARAWKEELARLSAAGEKWRMEHWQAEMPPPGENAAFHPVFAEMDGRQPAGPASITGFGADVFEDPEWVRQARSTPESRAVLSDKSRRPVIAAWETYLAGKEGGSLESGAMFPALAKKLSERARLFTGLEEALSRPHRQMPLRRELPYQQAGRVISMLRLIQLRLGMHLAEGNLDEALKCWRLANGIAALCASEYPMVLQRLIRDTVAGLADDMALQIAAECRTEADETVLKAMCAENPLPMLLADEDIVESLRGERGWMMTFAESASSTNAPDLGQQIDTVFPRYFPGGWIRIMGVTQSRRHQWAIDRLNGLRSSKERVGMLVGYTVAPADLPWLPIQIPEAVQPMTLRMLYHAHAIRRLTRAALVCTMHRCRNQLWPESLDSLSPDLRIQVLRCPVNEVLPEVRPAADGSLQLCGLVLWYPGLDSDDDRGTAVPREQRKEGAFQIPDGDWAISVPPPLKT